MQGSPTCLSRLNDLLERVRRTVQSRKQTNSLASYRIGFEIAQPTLLLGGKMQPHQLEALQWMVNLTSQNSNAILADDMGLGKTIQAISYFAYLKEEHGVTGKHLVLCPKSVCTNWLKEVKKWFPSANVQLLLNTQEEREEILRKVVRPRKFDILITTYEGAKTCLGVLSRISWEVLVVDEAHKLKNSQSQNFLCIKVLQASFKLLLTGTPLSNNLKELWSLLNFIMPDLFQDESLFDKIQDSADHLQGTEEEKLAYQCKIAATFHKIIDPFFKRRTKKNLELGLPQKIEKTLYVPLSSLQLQCYRNFLKYGNVQGPTSHIHNYHIMCPRKICLHPYLFDSIREREEQEEEKSKQSPEESGKRMIEASGKLKILDKLLHKLISQNHKVLIFSQFTMLLDMLETYCFFRQYKFCRIDGVTTMDGRERQMDRFNNSQEYPIFLLSTRAGGLGINLVSADTVIIYDIDWNPQNDIQAMDRAYRMGQTRTVHVYKLITEHTIEERMLEFQKYKLIWDELVIQKGGFMGKNKRKDDPFSNMNLGHLALLGKGDIFKLEADESDQNIDVVLQLGEQKDRKQDEEIRKKMMQNIDRSNFNPFTDEPQTCEEIEKYQSDIIIRRNYEQQKRQRTKFDRIYVIPAFKFYVKAHKIRELEFELYMEFKRDDQDRRLIAKIQQELTEAKQKGMFEHWSEIQYGLFLEAHKSCLKNDYDGISTFIGTKNQTEVMEYSTNFFEKAPNNQRLIAALNELQVNQAKLRKEKARQAGQEKKKQEAEVKKNPKSAKEAAEDRKKQEEAKKKEEAAKKKEEIEKKRQEDKRLKEQAKIKKEEQIRLREETKRMKEEEKKKKAEEREIMLQQRKKAKEKAQLDRIGKKQKREAEIKARKEREEQNLRKKQQKDEEERISRDKRLQSLENIREEFERKRVELQRKKTEAANAAAAWTKAQDAQTSCTDDKDSRDKLQIVTPKDSKALVI